MRDFPLRLSRILVTISHHSLEDNFYYHPPQMKAFGMYDYLVFTLLEKLVSQKSM